MTREQIKEHYAEVVKIVLMAEATVKPGLDERRNALGDNPTHEQIREMGDKYCHDIAEEILSRTPDEELEKIY